MREELARLVPGVRVLDGSAEDTGLDDASVDVATFAQSWHWVDLPAASAELARIIRPGGLVAMVWNVFDDSVPWLDRFEDAMHAAPLAWARGRDAEDQAAGVAPVGPFGPGERHTVTWTDRMTRADLLELVTTRSYYLASPPDEQAAMDAAVRETLDRHHPGVADDEVLDVSYRTVCVRYRRH
jgi:SAM-dependent methyltransferase